jgi:EamA-like transporter family.
MMLLAAMFYAGYTVGLRKRPKVEDFTMLAYLALVAWFASAILLLADLGIEGEQQWPGELSAWLVILYVALVPSLLSQILFMRGVQLVGSNKAGVYTNLLQDLRGNPWRFAVG